jgi:hypothetical protein
MTNVTMEEDIKEYTNYLADNFSQWHGVTPTGYQIQRQKEYRQGMTVEAGRKWFKVIAVSGTQRSVHSFIVMEDDGKFKAGDILKAASWAAPAKNFARGNVLSKQYGTVSWTGA